ncbi:MAG: rod shape-determining protein [Lachnospiraceae bacterium]|jgi:rod shape-determining protein MreB
MPRHKTLGIDLGTSTIKICSDQKDTIIKEKNMIAIRNGNQILAIGSEAYEMYEKAPVNIQVESPMAYGKIANVNYTEAVLKKLLEKEGRNSLSGSTLYLSVPADMSEIEKRAYYTIASGSRKDTVHTVEKPIADAIALGIPIETTRGAMIVNVGAQSTEISVIADGRVIISKIVEIGGKQLNEAIVSAVRRRYHLHIGTRTAKRLKISMGSFRLKKKEERTVWGIDSVSGLPREEMVSSLVIHEALCDSMDVVGREIKFFLERTPPQIYHSIIEQGIYLTGGTTRLPDIDWYLQQETGYEIRLSAFYELCTIYGLREIISHDELKKWSK